MLNYNQDAYGHLLSDYHKGQENVLEIIEREDGLITASPSHPQAYFHEYSAWPEHQKQGIKYAAGRILDVGSGAGCHALYLQKQGHDVLGTDNSPLAIQLCQHRGLKNAQVMSITQLSPKLGTFDTFLMLGNNFGLVSNFKRARWLLKRFATMTTQTAKIIAEATNPYETEDQLHLHYHQVNRDRGRMSGQLRLRVRHKKYATPWFDYLFLSKSELDSILQGTNWTVERYIDNTDTPSYIAILQKLSPAKDTS